MDLPPAPLRRNRDFMLLWSGQAISELGTQVTNIAIPLLVLAETHSAAKAGIAGFTSGLPYIVVGAYAGAIVDRWDRRRLMLLCDAARFAAAASVAIAIPLHALSYGQILAATLVIGTGSAFAGPAEFTALRHLVHERQLPAAISQNEARIYAAELSGPPLGGLLFGLGRALPFLADAVSYCVSFASLLLIRRPFQEERAPPTTHPLQDVLEGARWIWRQPFIRATTLRAGVGNFVSNGLAFMIVVVAREHGTSAAKVGLIYSVAAAGGLLGAFAAPLLQRKVPAGAVVVGYHAVYPLLIPVFLVVPPIGYGFLFGLMLFGAPALNAVLGTLRFAVVPDRLMGRVEAATAVVTAGASPLSRLTAGLVIGAFGATPAIEVWIVLAAALAVAVAITRSLRDPPRPQR